MLNGSVDLDSIKRMGSWLMDAVGKYYLRFFPPSGLLAAGGWQGK